jgi:hypothetical protein
MIELEGEDEFKDNFRCLGELVGEGEEGGRLTFVLRTLAKGSLGELLLTPADLEGRINLSAILSLGSFSFSFSFCCCCGGGCGGDGLAGVLDLFKSVGTKPSPAPNSP